MKQLYSLLLFLVLTPSMLVAQVKTEYNKTSEKTFGKLGLTHTISTQGHTSDKYTNNLSFNLLAGKSYNEYGLNINGGVGIVKNNASGLQISGLYSRIDNRSRGVSVAGIYNMVNRQDGAMLTFGFNSASKLKGVQSGGFNLATEMHGLQVGFANISTSAKGVQAGIANISDSLRGLQIGLINEIKTTGIQVGIMNIAPHNDYPIGFVNLIQDGDMKLGIEADEMTNTMVTFRSGGRVLYGIVGLGYNIKSENHLMAIEQGLGMHTLVGSRFRLDIELMSGWLLKSYTTINTNYINKNEEEYDDDRLRSYHSLFRTSIRILPNFKMSDRFEIFAGPTLNYIQSKDDTNRKLFAKKYFWQNGSTSHLKQFYPGFVGGIQYVF